MLYIDELREIMNEQLKTPVDEISLCNEDVLLLANDSPDRTVGERNDGADTTSNAPCIKEVAKTQKQRAIEYAMLLNDVFGDPKSTTYLDFMEEAMRMVDE